MRKGGTGGRFSNETWDRTVPADREVVVVELLFDLRCFAARVASELVDDLGTILSVLAGLGKAIGTLASESERW